MQAPRRTEPSTTNDDEDDDEGQPPAPRFLKTPKSAAAKFDAAMAPDRLASVAPTPGAGKIARSTISTPAPSVAVGSVASAAGSRELARQEVLQGRPWIVKREEGAGPAKRAKREEGADKPQLGFQWVKANQTVDLTTAQSDEQEEHEQEEDEQEESDEDEGEGDEADLHCPSYWMRVANEEIEFSQKKKIWRSKFSLAHSCTHLLDHSLTHSLTNSLTRSLARPLAHSLTHLLTHSITHSLSHSLACGLARSLAH